MSIAPGWYQDPAEPTTKRWWDGEGWVGDPVPADTNPPPGPPPAPAPAEGPRPDQAPRPDTGPRLDAGPHPDQPHVPDRVAAPERTSGVPPPGPGRPAAPVPPGSPYRVAVTQPPPQPHGHPLATLGARAVARLVDIGLVFALNVAVNGWFVYQYWTEISPAVAEIWRRGMAGDSTLTDLPEVGDRAGTLQIVILIIAAALWFAYEVPAVANTGQTPGKRLLGIKVVRLEEPTDRLANSAGAPPPLGFGRSFRRWNTMGLPTLLWWCFGLGFVLQLVDAAFAMFDRPLQQALHDKSAHTAVVIVAAGSHKEASDAPADPS